jgi:putative peptidoglycan lipid II flippase
MTGERSTLARAAGIVGAATLLSRLLGFVRDVVIASRFGTGMRADAFFVAFRLPNTLRELLGEGALSAAFVPMFTARLASHGRDAARALAGRVLGTFLVALGLAVVAGILAAPVLIRIQAPGFAATPAKLALTIALAQWMFPYLLCVGTAALVMGVLNALDHFVTPALAPSVLNLGLIGATLILAPRLTEPAFALAAGVLLGGMAQLAIQLPPLRRLGPPGPVRIAFRDPEVRRIARLMVPGAIGLAITQVNQLLGTLLASFLGEGGVASLYYAFRLVQFPIGVVGVALGTAALPPLARAVAAGRAAEARATLVRALRLALFLTVPALVGLLVFAQPIIRLLFERGAFGADATTATAGVLRWYALGLGCYVANRLVVPAYHAHQDTRTPVRYGALAVACNLAASLALIGPLGVGGIAAGTALGSGVNSLLLFRGLRVRLGPWADASWAAWGGKVLAASGAMGGVGLLVRPLTEAGGLATVAALAATAGSYVLAAAALRCPEVREAWAFARRGRSLRASGEGSFPVD